MKARPWYATPLLLIAILGCQRASPEERSGQLAKALAQARASLTQANEAVARLIALLRAPRGPYGLEDGAEKVKREMQDLERRKEAVELLHQHPSEDAIALFLEMLPDPLRYTAGGAILGSHDDTGRMEPTPTMIALSKMGVYPLSQLVERLAQEPHSVKQGWLEQTLGMFREGPVVIALMTARIEQERDPAVRGRIRSFLQDAARQERASGAR